MRTTRTVRAGLVAAALLAAGAASHAPPQSAPPGPAPGDPGPRSVHGGRRAVMNGVDADAGRVKEKPVKTTVEKMLDFPRPLALGVSELEPEFADHRVEGVETTVWELEAQIDSYQL